MAKKQNELAEYKQLVERRVGELLDVVQKVSSGDLTVRVPVPEERPFADLAVALRTMVDSLQEASAKTAERRAQAVLTSTEISQEIAVSPALDELFRRVVNLVTERFGYYHAHVYLLDQEADCLTLVEGYGDSGRIMKEQGHRIELGKGLVGRAAATGEPVLVPDVSKDPGWLPNPLLPETKAEVAVPIKLRGEVLGVLDVQANTVGGLTHDDEVLLLGLGGQIASAIQSTRLLAETQRRAQEATALYRTAEAIGRVGDLEGTFQSLAEALVEVLGYSSSWIAVVNEAGDAIQGVAGYGYGMTEQTVKGSEPLHEGYMNPTVLAVLQRQAIVVNDPATDERAADIPAEVRALASKLAEVPIMIGDEAVGILAVSRLADQPDITERDVEVLQAVANQAAVAMENARLLAETHTSLERLQQAYEAQAHLAQTVRELSTPIVPVTREVLVLPLVGALDAQRAEQVIASLLKSIEEQRARVVIMDITGVPVVDTHVANYLLRAALAARLLGAEVILVGITPQVAQAVVGLGVDLSEIVTRSDLQSGIEYALGLVGMTIVEKH